MVTGDRSSQRSRSSATTRAPNVYDSGTRLEKAYNKVRYELPGRLRGRPQHLSPATVTRRSLDAFRSFRPDLVLVIRGDSLTSAFWDEVQRAGAKGYLWLWDEIRRMSHPPEWLHSLPQVATYSAADAASLRRSGVEAIHVLNAFDPSRSLRPQQPTAEVTFIGARFARRESALNAIRAADIPVRAYGRDWSSHPVDRLRTWRLATPEIPADRDVSLDEALAVMRDSVATLNIHGDQDGFTMRTFEACGVGAVQLIDRPDVADLFEPEQEVLVFTDEAELVDQARRAMAEPERMQKLRDAARARALAEHTFVHRARDLEALWA